MERSALFAMQAPQHHQTNTEHVPRATCCVIRLSWEVARGGWLITKVIREKTGSWIQRMTRGLVGLGWTMQWVKEGNQELLMTSRSHELAVAMEGNMHYK